MAGGQKPNNGTLLSARTCLGAGSDVVCQGHARFEGLGGHTGGDSRANAGNWNHYTGDVLRSAACGPLGANAQDHCVLAMFFSACILMSSESVNEGRPDKNLRPGLRGCSGCLPHFGLQVQGCLRDLFEGEHDHGGRNHQVCL